jgi:hypothetical protein
MGCLILRFKRGSNRLLRITKRPCLLIGLIFRLVDEKECRLFLTDLRHKINFPVRVIALGLLFFVARGSRG